MHGDKECEEHNCKGLGYCKWHPDQCQGKPWKQTDLRMWQRILRPACFGNELNFSVCARLGACPFSFDLLIECGTAVIRKRVVKKFKKERRF